MNNRNLYSLSDDELYLATLEKNKLGVATPRALRAQMIRWARATEGKRNVRRNNDALLDDCFESNGDYFDNFIDYDNDIMHYSRNK